MKTMQQRKGKESLGQQETISSTNNQVLTLGRGHQALQDINLSYSSTKIPSNTQRIKHHKPCPSFSFTKVLLQRLEHSNSSTKQENRNFPENQRDQAPRIKPKDNQQNHKASRSDATPEEDYSYLH